MPAFLVAIEFHHHNASHHDYKRVIDIPEGADPRVHGLLNYAIEALTPDVDVMDDDVIAEVVEAYESINGTDKTTVLTLEGADGPEKWQLSDGGKDGVRLSDGTRDGSVWVRAAPFVHDLELAKRLEPLSREELLDLLQRAAVER